MKNLRQGLNSNRLDISYLQDRLDFEDILEQLGIVIAYRLGMNIMCHCPFPENHSNGDKNASFGFDEEKMAYNCFVCGGGGLLDLVKQLMGFESDQEAATWLQNNSNMEPQSAGDLKKRLAKIMNPVPEMQTMPEYPLSTLEPWMAYHPYLRERGIDKETACRMSIGFDPDHHGLVIPHFWHGKLVGWQVRHLALDTKTGNYHCPTCQQVPKYKSTQGMPKSTTLYNYDNVVREGYISVTVVESPMSALYMIANDYPNVVATFGSFNKPQMEHLKVFEAAYLWPDNDPAGSKNLTSAVDQLKYSIDVRVVPVVDKPHGDAADVPPEEFMTYWDNAYLPALMPLFESPLVTLEQVQANTNERR